MVRVFICPLFLVMFFLSYNPPLPSSPFFSRLPAKLAMVIRSYGYLVIFLKTPSKLLKKWLRKKHKALCRVTQARPAIPIKPETLCAHASLPRPSGVAASPGCLGGPRGSYPIVPHQTGLQTQLSTSVPSHPNQMALALLYALGLLMLLSES